LNGAQLQKSTPGYTQSAKSRKLKLQWAPELEGSTRLGKTILKILQTVQAQNLGHGYILACANLSGWW